MKVKYRIFSSPDWKDWQQLFDQAAAFASTLHPSRLISIEHRQPGINTKNAGIVTVWYWAEED